MVKFYDQMKRTSILNERILIFSIIFQQNWFQNEKIVSKSIFKLIKIFILFVIRKRNEKLKKIIKIHNFLIKIFIKLLNLIFCYV